MKKAFVPIVALTMLLLTGCSAVDKKLEQVLLEKSGIFEHEDYLQYQQYQKEGKLDEKGQYIVPNYSETSTDIEEKIDGKIHITFAENRYLDIEYYTDSTMTTPIDKSFCYLNAGDTLYAKVIECNNPNSNLYRLAEFRIVTYDTEGNVKNELQHEVVEGMLKYKIPSNFIGQDMAVIPVGEYPDRKLSMGVFYVDDNGNKCSLGNAGTWSINNENIESNLAQISPIESYVLKFTYDKENYFYVGCQPDCFTKDPVGAGFVEFWEAEPTDADMDYQVELHKFLNLSLKFSEEAKICINQGDAEAVEKTVKKNKVWNGEKLQYGDSIIIETAGECTITGGNYQHISATKDPILNGYRYTLKVVQETESDVTDVLEKIMDVKRIFNVILDTKCDYGTCIYKLDGEVVSGMVQLQEGQELILTYKITNKDYAFANKSEGIDGFIHDLFKSSERTVIIPITADLEGATINVNDWFDIVKKGEESYE